MYTYKAKLSRVIDGDTIELLVDLGFSITIKEKFRLAGIDTPEITGSTKSDGLISKQFTENFMKSQDTFILKVSGKDKYGRWVAHIYNDLNESLNNQLINNKLAAIYI